MHQHTRLAGLLAASAALGASLHAENTTTLEERLARIEAQLARLEAKVGEAVTAEELAPTLRDFSDLSKQLGFDGKNPVTTVKPAGKVSRMTLGGYVQAVGEWGGEVDSRYAGINDRFLLRRARLTLKTTWKEHFDATFMSDFANNSISANSNYRAQLADAFIAWTNYDQAVVTIGQFKTPFGHEQLLADTKTLLHERSLPNDLLTVNRQIGAGLSGAFHDKRLTYSVAAFNGNGVNNGNNDNDQFMYAGRVAGTPWTSEKGKLSLGANAFHTRDNGSFTGERTGLGADAQLTLGRFDFAAEYLRQKRDRVTGTDVTADGWYVLGAYFIVPKVLQVVGRYETYDSDTDTAATTSELWTVGLNYYIKGDDLRLSANYMFGDPAAPLDEAGRFSLRMQVIF